MTQEMDGNGRAQDEFGSAKKMSPRDFVACAHGFSSK
jgi:hypothetical protein